MGIIMKKELLQKKGGFKQTKCLTNNDFSKSIKSVMNKNLVVNTYGSIYKTTGGGNNSNWFIKTFVPNTIKLYKKSKNNTEILSQMMKQWNNKNKKNKISKNYCQKILSDLKKNNKNMYGGSIKMPRKWFTK